MRKIINNLRTWLIHKLGGVTSEECFSKSYKSYIKGELVIIGRLRIYANSLYGLTAEDWCKKMYKRISYYYETSKP